MADSDRSNVDYADLIKAQTREVDIDAFKERGMKKVNVINSKKINELIAQAVTNIITRMEDADIQTIKDDKAQIVMDSMDEFKRLFEQQRKEADSQGKVQQELGKLRDEVAKQAASGGAAPSVQIQGIHDGISELKAFLTSQAGKSQGHEMTRAMVVDKQTQVIEERFKEIKAALAAGAKPGGEDGTKRVLEETVNRVAKLLEQGEKNRNGAGNEAVIKALGDFRTELSGKFDKLAGALKESTNARGADNAGAIKAEIAALREDLAQKTVAASAAGSAALQAQLTQMKEMLAKGGGGGMGGADMNELVAKLEGSMSKKLADAGLMKQEVSAEEAISVGSVMVNSAFRGMEDIETNLGAMDAAKTTDKEGGKKAKGALDALKKLKGK